MPKANTGKTEKLIPVASAQLNALWKEHEDYLESGSKDQSHRMRFPSGIPALDKAMGKKQFTRGIVQILGDEAVGKTSLTYQILATTQRERELVELQLPDGNIYNAVFMDFEHTYDRDYARALGVDTDKLLVLEMPYAEQQFNIVEELLVAGMQFVVIDSISNVIPLAEQEKDLEDAVKMAGEAGVIGRALKRMNALAFSSDALVLMINQYRSNISPMAMKEKKPYGARIMKHLVKATIELRVTERKDTRMTVEAFISKNKMGALGSKISYQIEHGKGIDVNHHILMLAYDLDIVEKAGTWWYYPDKATGTYKGQGDANAVRNFPMDEIKSLVLERLANE